MPRYNNNKKGRTNAVDPDEVQSYHHHYGGDDCSQLSRATRHHDYGEEEEVDGPCMIRVIAPATLQEGYTFDVLVDEEPYTVEVPPGGIQEGQEFEVEYHPDQQHNYSYEQQGTTMSRLAEEETEDGVYVEDGEESELKDAPTKTMSGDYDEEEGQPHAPVEESEENESKAIWYVRRGSATLNCS